MEHHPLNELILHSLTWSKMRRSIARCELCFLAGFERGDKDSRGFSTILLWEPRFSFLRSLPLQYRQNKVFTVGMSGVKVEIEGDLHNSKKDVARPKVILDVLNIVRAS